MRSSDATWGLVRLWACADCTTICGATRSFGFHHHSAEVADALWEMAAITENDAVFIAAVDGQARLGGRRALTALLDHEITTANCTGRCALRLNLANLLGECDEFC